MQVVSGFSRVAERQVVSGFSRTHIDMMHRRRFLQLAGAALAAPVVSQRGTVTDPQVDALFDRSIVIDALSADEDWDKPEPIFEAYKKAGLTAIHTSLSNRNFGVAMKDLAAWQARFDRWPDRLLKVLKAPDIAEAKKTGRV